MSGLFGGGGTISQTQEVLAGVQVSTSAYGLAIPLVYGRTRVAGNMVWYDDFTPIPHTTSQTAGKGGGGTTMTSTTYTYTAAVILALCEGPILGTNRYWRDKEEFFGLQWTSAAGSANFTLKKGDRAQSPWGYLQTKHPEQALGYGSTVYVADPAMDLGTSGATKNHSFEVVGIGSDLYLLDAQPGVILPDYLTEPVHGLGFPAARLNAAAVATWNTSCLAADILLSPAYVDQQPAIEHLKEMGLATNSAFIWSQGQLKPVSYADQPLTSALGLGVYFPNTTPIYDLGPDDFLADGSGDPVEVERKTQADAFNRVQVEFRNRYAADGTPTNAYNVEVAEATDAANIEQFGLRSQDPVKLHLICRPDLARATAQRLLQRALYIRNTFRFKLGPRHMLLEPMDLVTLTDSTLGLALRPVRITKVDEDAKGVLSLEAEDWPFGVATATRYGAPAGDPSGITWNADPGNALAPVIFEPPPTMTEGRAEIWIGACGNSVAWGGCDVWASRDGDSFVRVGTIPNPCRVGQLNTAMPLPGDALTPCRVDLFHGDLGDLSNADAARYAGQCYVGGEIFSYQHSLPILVHGGPARLELSAFQRGLFGSLASAFPPGTPFLRLDDAVGKFPMDRWEAGQTIFLKLVSFNAWGLGMQDLSEVAAYSYTFTNRAETDWPKAAGASFAISTTPPA